MQQKVFLISVCMILAAVSGCSKQPPTSSRKPEQTVSPQTGTVMPAFSSFFVHQDKGSKNRFTPSGYMPTGECLSLDDGWQYDVKDGKTCIRVVYDIACSKEGRQWAGVYWQNPADNWGGKKGGYNLTGATRLVFWAKGELGGERIEEFKIGGLGANQLYPDSDTASMGPVILSSEWKEYTLDLRGKDLSYISGGFAWVANVEGNPHHCTFYLDNIRFE
ncbi:MAG: hypothetical protein HQL21_01115 [Candidatus Omnitrophica bacterium]|nr:hypothetical protein [Candidatus Omnitrophota bacterium]